MSGRFAALRSRDFRLLFFGQLVSLTGSQMQTVAVPYQIYKLTGSSLALGFVGLARVIPVIVFALGGGVIADALDRRRLMMLSQSLMAICSLTLAWTTHTGHITPAVMYAIIAVGGAALSLDSPARQSLIPLLVPREHLANAIGLHAMAWEIAAIAGPSLAGLLIAWRGVFPVYVLDAASFAAVLGALVAMRHRAPPRASVDISIGAALDGLRFLARTPLILLDDGARRRRHLLRRLAAALAGLRRSHPRRRAARPRPALRGAAGRRRRRRGALVVARDHPPPGRRRALVDRDLRRRRSPRSASRRGCRCRWCCSRVSGAADTVSMVVRQTLRQLLTPDELRGRMTSVNMIFFIGGPQLGEFEAGVVARAAGPRFSVTSGGLGLRARRDRDGARRAVAAQVDVEGLRDRLGRAIVARAHEAADLSMSTLPDCQRQPQASAATSCGMSVSGTMRKRCSLNLSGGVALMIAVSAPTTSAQPDGQL